MENLENKTKDRHHKHLVDGKYSFKDLVDIDRLRVMFERFSQATGFTTGLISYPGQDLLISTGWRDICTRFHRVFPSSNVHCKQSNLTLTSNLKERKALNILHCESGLVDGATPIIIKGAHVANLATGQILFKKPDIKQFRKQGEEYGYDVDAYLEALEKVPVVTEKKFKEALGFLSEMAIMLAEQGLTELQIRKAAQTVFESEAKFRGIFENVQDVFFEITLDKVILEVSPSIENLSKGQYKRDYLIGKSLSEIYSNPEERKILLEELHKSGSVTDYEINFSNRDGSIIPCSISARIQFDKDGKPFKIISSMRDISERKLVEKALKESEEKYKNIVENIADVIFVLDGEGFIKYISSNIKTVLGYSPESTINKHFTKYVYPKDMKKSIEGFQSHMNGGIIPQEFRMVKKNGELIWVSILGKPKKGEKGIIFSGVLRDITDKKQAEEMLKLSEERFNLAMNASQDGIFDWNLITNDIYYSPGWKSMLGYEDHELPNDISIWENMTDPVDVKKSREKQNKVLAKNLDRFVLEFKMKHKKGHWVNILSHAETVFNESGKAIRMIGTHKDISERKQAENDLKIKNQELIEAKEKAEESDRLKSAFLTNMSHEIRTPMNGILGFADLLKEPELSGEEQHKYINIIENSGIRMLNIINDLIDISKVEAGQIEVNISEINVNEQIEYLYSFFKPEVERKGIKLSFINTLTNKNSFIKTDREKAYAILTNLIKNAVKYTNKGKIEFGYNKKDNNLEFFVKDTGIGIAIDRQQAVFERFVQADIEDASVFEGAGLGLSISKAYVEILGGRIWVESEEGVGSQFYFTIPYNPKTEEKIGVIKDTPKKKIRNQIKGLKVLIAEDVESADKHLSIVLKKISKEILHSKTGVETVDICRNNLDIDLVLMDIKMPLMNGHEATRKIREFNENVVIIAQTAYALYGDREKALEAGCDDYISKPINKEELMEMINKYLGNR
jgi:PAS domain S-box-containing protein